jgi:hypothetical protein
MLWATIQGLLQAARRGREFGGEMMAKFMLHFLPSAKNSGSGRQRGNSQSPGNLLVIQSLELSQHKGVAIFGFQGIREQACKLYEFRSAPGRLLGRVIPTRVRPHFLILTEEPGFFEAAMTQDVDAVVGGNAHEPVGKGPAGVELVQRSKGAQENFLNGILAREVIAEPATHRAPYGSLITLDQFRKSGPIPPQCVFNENSIRGIRHGRLAQFSAISVCEYCESKRREMFLIDGKKTFTPS